MSKQQRLNRNKPARFVESELKHPLGYLCIVRRSRVRRYQIALKILNHDTLQVSVPYRTPVSDILDFVSDHKSWIKDKAKTLSENNNSLIDLSDGTTITVMGQPFRLVWCVFSDLNLKPNTRSKIFFREEEETKILSNGLVLRTIKVVSDTSRNSKLKESRLADPILNVTDNLTKWIRSHAEPMMLERLRKWSNQVSIPFSTFKQKNLKRAWGLYRNTGLITLNWRLALAPIDALDGVIVHELCHHRIKGHQQDFWELVHHFYPEYKSKTHLWLKNHGDSLFIDRRRSDDIRGQLSLGF